ncbi:hypothetical protein [Streptomyces sp. NPDC060366]|uniref:hypothetical protein n=1 Tax=Streptomyces sp. NPDC060366 TaxID=3347105 RepID=UPI003660E919
MMPGTVLERATDHVTTAVLPSVRVDVADLTTWERVVALYASDMPNGRRHHTPEQRRAWIAQGVERMGHEEVARQASFTHAHKLLDMGGLVPAEVQRRHEVRFPKPRRLNVARQEAANSVCRDGMTEPYADRDEDIAVDGGCPCRGTGAIPAFYDEDCGPVDMLCPVHERARIHAQRFGVRA